MAHNEWLTDLIGADSIRHASQKVGFAATTITRQLQRGSLSPEMVISLCRAYDRSPVTGLIETGFLNAWETEGVSIPYALNQATNKQILDEIMNRSDPEATVLFGGGDDVIDVAPNAEVFPFPDTPRSFTNEQDEVRENTPNVQDGGYDPTRHVAYNGEDEDALRRDQEGDWEDPDHPIP